MKKIFPFFLIIVFAFNIFGAYFIYKVQQAKIRYEASNSINEYQEDELVNIRITNGNLHLLNWQKEGEFIFNGHFYDIVSFYVENDSIIYYKCKLDEKETQLLADYKKVQNQSKKSSKKSNKNAKRIVKQFNQFNDNQKNIFAFHYKLKPEYNNYIHKKYKNPLVDILSPPPQFIS